MRSKLGLWILAVMWLTTAGARTQGTAFTYQGRLQDGTIHASGFYDLTFSVWTTPAGPAQIGGSVTNLATGLTNGLFAVSLDFGSSVFDGSPRWLEVAVRTNGSGAFTTLLPRQSLNAAPYAIFAGGVNAAGISGVIPAASIASGTITSNMLAPGAAAANLAASDQSAVPGGGMVLSASQDATKLLAMGYSRFGGPLELSWQNVAGSQSLVARGGHTAVWTGSKMIVWGGVDNNGLNPKNTGIIYDPMANLWSNVETNNSPSGRSAHTATWTGTEMIIWGGYGGGYLNDGGRLNLTTGTWLPVSTNNAPTARRHHTAVWTGSEMVVWGGNGDGDTMLDTGGRYNPSTDTWLPLSNANAPTGRMLHTAVWTGNEMIVWGGLWSITKVHGDGARYDPTGDTWTPVTTNGAPAGRAYHVAVWIGTEMFVWGGWGGDSGIVFGEGFRYAPSLDAWKPVTKVGAPYCRSSPSTVWTGKEIIVWGRISGNSYSADGSRYDPATDAWFAVAKTGAPDARQGHTAVWTGSEMLVFGGYDEAKTFNDCFSYAPSRVMYLYLRQ